MLEICVLRDTTLTTYFLKCFYQGTNMVYIVIYTSITTQGGHLTTILLGPLFVSFPALFYFHLCIFFDMPPPPPLLSQIVLDDRKRGVRRMATTWPKMSRTFPNIAHVGPERAPKSARSASGACGARRPAAPGGPRLVNSNEHQVEPVLVTNTTLKLNIQLEIYFIDYWMPKRSLVYL